MKKPTIGSYEKSPSYELFILMISILAIMNFAIYFLPWASPPIKDILHIVSTFIGFIFLYDFLYRFFTAPSKSVYFFHRLGWADFLAAIPFSQFNVLRIFRVFKTFARLHEFGVKNTIYYLRDNLANTALYSVIFLMILIIQFGSIAVLYAEANNADANITTASDAMWWAFVSITTVGYGDMYPVTNSGRLVGVAVLTVGVGLFGVVTGFLANKFLRTNQRQDD